MFSSAKLLTSSLYFLGISVLEGRIRKRKINLLWGWKRILPNTREADVVGSGVSEKDNGWATDGGIKSLLETFIALVLVRRGRVV